VLNGDFAAGIDVNGRLIVIGKSGPAIITVDRRCSLGKLNWGRTEPKAERPRPSIRRLVFQKSKLQKSYRMLIVVRATTRRSVTKILRVQIGTSITPDLTWGTNGAWTGPSGFDARDLLVHPTGDLVLVGWTTVKGGVVMNAIRVAGDGKSDRPFIQQRGAVPQPFPFHAGIDANGGLLAAMTGPNPLSVFLPGLAEVGWVLRWDSSGQFDTTFGTTQGVLFAQHLGYSITVRGIVPTPNGFFLACDRPATIERQISSSLPIIFAFDLAGHPLPGFGETGIVRHDTIPAAVQLHDASSVIAAGVRRVLMPAAADQFELAVTTVGTAGNVLWHYGTTHGQKSGPVVVGGQRANAFWLTHILRWGQYLAIGGNAWPSLGFVTIRNADGSLLPAGTASLVQIGEQIISLDPLPNGALEVTYSTGGGTRREKRSLITTPSFRIDPAVPPTQVPFPRLHQITLADGSIVSAKWDVNPFNNSIRIWLTKDTDANYGGGTLRNRFVDTSGWPMLRFAEVHSFITLPAGGFLLLHVIFGAPGSATVPNAFLPTPQGIVVTAWQSANGAPDPGWANPFEDHHATAFRQLIVDPPDGIVIVGSTDSLVANPPEFGACLQRVLIAACQ
jgi:hypothetical protein